MVVRNRPLGRIDVNIINDIWRGSIDMHIHPRPDPLAERPVNNIQTAQMAERSKMGEIVPKSFSYNTVSDAYLIEEDLTSSLRVFGNVAIGCATTDGLPHTPETIEVMAKIGCKIVWFPAMDSKWCRSYLRKEGGISILKKDGILKDEVPDILELMRQHDMAVCPGHVSYEESIEVFDAAMQKGIMKMVATHPSAELSRFTLDQIQELVAKGVYIEHVYGTLMPCLGDMDPNDYIDCAKLIGIDRCITRTDLAQVWGMTPTGGMRHFIATVIQFRYTPAEVEAVSKKNPAKLLGMEEGQEGQ